MNLNIYVFISFLSLSIFFLEITVKTIFTLRPLAQYFSFSEILIYDLYLLQWFSSIFFNIKMKMNCQIFPSQPFLVSGFLCLKLPKRGSWMRSLNPPLLKCEFLWVLLDLHNEHMITNTSKRRGREDSLLIKNYFVQI